MSQGITGATGVQGADGVGAGITVRTTAGPAGTVGDTVDNPSIISFDSNTGFSVQGINSDEVFVELGSSFAPWIVDGQPTLTPVGEETIEFVAKAGIAITTKNTETGTGIGQAKAIYFESTGGGGSGATNVDEIPTAIEANTINLVSSNAVGLGTTDTLYVAQTDLTYTKSTGQLDINSATNGASLLLRQGGDTTQQIVQQAAADGTGSINWTGTAGNLFSISNNLTQGTIFGVGDVSGVPIIDVNADRTVSLVPVSGAVGVASTIPRNQPETKFDVNGTIVANFYQNPIEATADYILPDNFNTFVAGPYTIPDGITIDASAANATFSVV